MTDANKEQLERMAQALRRLREAVALEAPSRLEIDGAIQRFEFSYELAWKALRSALATEGREVNSPRQSFRAAYQPHDTHLQREVGAADPWPDPRAPQCHGDPVFAFA